MPTFRAVTSASSDVIHVNVEHVVYVQAVDKNFTTLFLLGSGEMRLQAPVHDVLSQIAGVPEAPHPAPPVGKVHPK